MKTFSAYCYSLLFLCLLVLRVDAFCVYNTSSQKKIVFRQRMFNCNATDLSRFQTGLMAPGDKSCCPYTDSDCSNIADKDLWLMMDIFIPDVCYHTITFVAGGWIEVSDDVNDPANITISVFKADGTVYKFSYLDNTETHSG